MVSRETRTVPDWLLPSLARLDDYADLLSGPGVERGLIGPREVPRLWERHLLNCAVVADPSIDLIAANARCADVGSGAGLPGLVWAVVRPDLHVTLIEPLLRRARFLHEAVERLDLAERVQVVRDRAEQCRPEAGFDVVTARAVAPLERLVGWTVRLLRPGGLLVALKGQSAQAEVAAAAAVTRDVGLVDLRVISVGLGTVDPPTTLIVGRRAQ
mgnify:CR=1 FL=1